MTQFGPKLAFLVNLGQAMQAYSVPCRLVGWWLWRAGCIAQDTYLLYTSIVGVVKYCQLSIRCCFMDMIYWLALFFRITGMIYRPASD